MTIKSAAQIVADLFVYIFRRETLTHLTDAALSGPKLRRNRLTALVAQLRERKKMTDSDVIALFRSQFGATLVIATNGASLGKSQISTFEEMATHFEEFADSGFRDHDSFCRKKRREWHERRGTAYAVEGRLLPKSPEAKKSAGPEGALRGLYMGQMLNEARETNEHLKNIHDSLGGSS